MEMSGRGSKTIIELQRLQEEIIRCELCPRLVGWRTQVAREKVKRFADQEYWGRPVPSFGDPHARLLVIGLAPAAHGGNRTGRIFTGDRSGDWLYATLHRFGFANQPQSIHRNDGLKLIDCYITAVIRCAPPENKPMPEEIVNCRSYLLRELHLLRRVKVVVALGRIAFDAAIAAVGIEAEGGSSKRGQRKRPQFTHGVQCALMRGITLLASFHPSQQNTFTGRLTQAMFDDVFRRARALLEPNT